MTTSSVISNLKRHFSVHRTPHTLISDNAGQYTSQQFNNFAKQWDFLHTTSSPEFPRSNDLAKRAVCSAKQLLKKNPIERKQIYSWTSWTSETFLVTRHLALLLNAWCPVRHEQPFRWTPSYWNQRTSNTSTLSFSTKELLLQQVAHCSLWQRYKWFVCRFLLVMTNLKL